MIITYSQMYLGDKYSKRNSIIWPDWRNICEFVYKVSGCGFKFLCSHLNFRYRGCFEQELLDTQEIIVCGLTVKYVRDMIIKYSQISIVQLNRLARLAKWLSVCLRSNWL